MKIEVLYFASLAEATGRARETVEIDAGADVRGLWESITGRYPALEQLHYRPMVACDMEYSDWNSSLRDVREVAFLPPVSGG